MSVKLDNCRIEGRAKEWSWAREELELLVKLLKLCLCDPMGDKTIDSVRLVSTHKFSDSADRKEHEWTLQLLNEVMPTSCLPKYS